jgi:uncharacterized membrane protein YecN with MAPEG domain
MISFDDNPWNKWCVFVWISAVLIWKNIIFSLILTIFRLKHKQEHSSEDAPIFIRKRRVANEVISTDIQRSEAEEWSLTNRIATVLVNETEYVPYFLLLFLAYIFVPEVTTTRTLVYGCVFVLARYTHNIGLIIRLNYARIIGFLFSILVLGVLTLDLAITITISMTKPNFIFSSNK